MDTCIALRTFVIKNDKLYVQAGAGIVADSQPEMEYQETLNKARGLLKAVEITAKRSPSHASWEAMPWSPQLDLITQSGEADKSQT